MTPDGDVSLYLLPAGGSPSLVRLLREVSVVDSDDGVSEAMCRRVGFPHTLDPIETLEAALEGSASLVGRVPATGSLTRYRRGDGAWRARERLAARRRGDDLRRPSSTLNSDSMHGAADGFGGSDFD